MKQGSFPIKLIGPSGTPEQWTVELLPLGTKKDTVYGYTVWDDKKIQINSRIRSSEMIDRTLMHETEHVTYGQNASETGVENHEKNYVLLRKKLTGFLESDDE